MNTVSLVIVENYATMESSFGFTVNCKNNDSFYRKKKEKTIQFLIDNKINQSINFKSYSQ